MRIYSQKNKGGIIWGIDCKNPITGKRFMQIIGTKKQAEDSLAKHRQETVLYKAYGKKEYFEMQNSVVEDITFSDYDKIYLEHAYANKKSADRDARSIKALSDYVVDQEKNIRFGDLKLSSITQKMIEDYKVYRLKQVKSVCLNSVIQEYVKPSTVNREISCLKHMLELAVDWKYLFINPAKKVKEFDEDDSYVRYLELNEVGPLINACGTLKRAVYLKPIVVIALNSGMRKTEILCLKQKDIDFKKGLTGGGRIDLA